MTSAEREHVIWHDLECGAYAADLPLWRELAARHRDPVLDVGAGSGRVTLDLARRGHRLTALDRDPVLVAELARRAQRLAVRAVRMDARALELSERFALIIVPMQTIQLLGGAGARARFLAACARHLKPRGALACAITERLECFDIADGVAPPTPDMREIDGVVYCSQPTAVRATADGFVLERLRERIDAAGQRTAHRDRVRLDRLAAVQLEREMRAAGLEPSARRLVRATADHVGSLVVVARLPSTGVGAGG